jgi:hypothetical protein
MSAGKSSIYAQKDLNPLSYIDFVKPAGSVNNGKKYNNFLVFFVK